MVHIGIEKVLLQIASWARHGGIQLYPSTQKVVTGGSRVRGQSKLHREDKANMT
jgi:hypothetical protein